MKMKKIFSKKQTIFITTFLLAGILISPGVYLTKGSNSLFKENNNIELQNIRGSVPTITDNSGKTNFHGLFIGPSYEDGDKLGNQAKRMSNALNGPGWNNNNKTTLENGSATKDKIQSEIEKLIDKAKPGEEVVIYICSHGNNDHAQDGKQDPWEDDADPNDDPDDFDNCIITAGNEVITDDELANMISGFPNCTTITIVIDSCYSGTFTDGTADLPSAHNEDGDEYGTDHLAVITSGEGTTPHPNDPNSGSLTDKIIDGLKPNGTTTNADKNKDGKTTSEELGKYNKKKMKEEHMGDRDHDGLADEDDVDVITDPVTGDIDYLHIDNDGDGLIDEDIAPTNPKSWYTPEWYVDDDASPGGDGSKENPYNTIQLAINNADEGDRIIVLDGVYQEQLTIDKENLDFVGEYNIFDPYEKKSILRGNQDVPWTIVTINKPFTIFTGFIFENCGNSEEDAAISISSDYNVISRNLIQNNGATGIYLQNNAQYNYIYRNTIQNNDGAGLFIWQESFNNYIYHNNYIENIWYNVKDKDGGNIWNDVYPSGGNYWNDYTGVDNNGDGIGDEPYYIMGDLIITGLDNYPWMTQNGWNNPPATPTIIGQTKGKPNKEYEYTFKATDTDKDWIYFEIDWGDQGQFEWSDLTSYEAKIKHTYGKRGTYTIRARAVDTYGAESDWGTLTVTMPRNRAVSMQFKNFLENQLNTLPILQQILQRLEL